ncbi:MAG: HEAT repeat domain-containing protein, partial [Verrucomicrobia bacterium]|nr:HEAT repeat domain-containing protein [Verrucomicrobiota bacterium]
AASVAPLRAALMPSAPLPARRHAAWALGQIARQAGRAGGLDPTTALDPLIPLLSDPSPELRAVAASVLGDQRHAPAVKALQGTLVGGSPPMVVREAALALGRIGASESLDSLVAAARSGASSDPILRHALVMGMLGCADAPALMKLGGDVSPGVRLVAVVALRRLERPELAHFLSDPDPAVRAEAARAIHDLPIAAALPDLAGVSDARLSEAPFSRRVVNACLRVGTRESARRLGEIAANERLPEAIRSEALIALAAWPGTAGRDRVTGLWRPLVFQRSDSDARDALRPGLGSLLASPAPALVADAASAAAALQIREVAPTLAALTLDARRPAGVRTTALQALATLEDPSLPQTLDPLFADADPAVRSLALRLAARANGPGAFALLRRVLDTGSDSDRQAAFAGLARLEHPEVAALLGQWMERLLAGTVPPAVQLDLLEAATARSDPGLDDQRRRFRESGASDPIAAYAVSLEGGSAAAGEAVFQSAEVQCIRCHKLWDRGGEVGPDLSAIGRQLDRRALLESVVTPDSRLATGYETVLVTLDDGEVDAGIAVGESAGMLTLRLADGSTVSVETARIRSRDRGASAMPSGLAEILGPRRLRDLIEYLASLK